MSGIIKILTKKWKLVLFLFSIIVIGGLGVFWIYWNGIFSTAQQVEISISDEDLGITRDDSLGVTENPTYYYENITGITNIALFGIDVFEGTKGRSDAIMILTIDRNTKKIKLSSIIRDSYVKIPGYGMDKINHAYSFGGPELALKTLNTNFSLDIRHFATVNFSTLPAIVDSLGGLDLTVTDKEATKIPGINTGGTYTLNGIQVREFARIRKIDSDAERTRRQRDVMEALITKLLSRPFYDYPGILETIMPDVITNLSSLDVLNISATVFFGSFNDIEKMLYPLPEVAGGQTIDGIYYYVFDIPSTRESIGRYIYLDQK